MGVFKVSNPQIYYKTIFSKQNKTKSLLFKKRLEKYQANHNTIRRVIHDDQEISNYKKNK